MWEKVLHGFGFEPATLGSVVQQPLGYRLQLPNRRKIFGIYALTLLTLLMYTVASPDPDPNLRGGGQLPNPKSAILR